MTDGPFRNAKLTSSWKRYGDDLVSEATSLGECAARACHSMLDEMDIKHVSALIRALQGKATEVQSDLDSGWSAAAVFAAHPPSLIGDQLQRHLSARLGSGIAFADAIELALHDTVKDWTRQTQIRMAEECMSARDRGDMARTKYDEGIARNSAVFASIDREALAACMRSGDKRAFKPVLNKTGVDEGPDP
jgi:hypothetical protein